MEQEDPLFLMSDINPEDVLMWPDNFWCLREELNPKLARDNDYHVIPFASDKGSRKNNFTFSALRER